MSIEEFILTNLGDLSGWGAFAVMVFLHLRNNRADSKEQSDGNKAQIELSKEILVDRRENTEAVKELTKTFKDLTTADLAAHKVTQDSLGAIQDTQTGIDRNVVNLIASVSQLEASFNATVDEFRNKHQETAKELAAIGLQVSDIKNSIAAVIEKHYPNPADTQEIPEEIQAKARSLSGGATTLIEGVILTLPPADEAAPNQVDEAA